MPLFRHRRNRGAERPPEIVRRDRIRQELEDARLGLRLRAEYEGSPNTDTDPYRDARQRYREHLRQEREAETRRQFAEEIRIQRQDSEWWHEPQRAEPTWSEVSGALQRMLTDIRCIKNPSVAPEGSTTEIEYNL